MKKIKLTRGEFALVDDEDFDELNKRSWHCSAKAYARASIKTRTGKFKGVYLHRFILKLKSYERQSQVDHIDGNPLNNQKNNLRICDTKENCWNQKTQKNNKSGYKGVSWYKHKNKWHSQIGYKWRTIHIGYFDSKEAAAIAYNKKAKKLYGKFALLNHVIGQGVDRKLVPVEEN